jgi:hypothetical protein
MLSRIVLSLALLILLSFGLLPQVYAHQVKNSITNTTTFIYNQDRHLYVNWDISMPTSEGDLVYNYIDINQDRVISEQERLEFLKKIDTVFYFKTQNQQYIPVNVEVITPYQELAKYIYPTLQLKLDFGVVDIGKEFSDITIYNNLKFNSILPQDWNIGFKNENTIIFDNLEYYPDKTIISNEIRAKVRSDYGNANSSIFKNQYLLQLKSFLKEPNLGLSSKIGMVIIGFLLGLLHCFRPENKNFVYSDIYKSSIVLPNIIVVIAAFALLFYGNIITNSHAILAILLIIFAAILILNYYKNYVDYKLNLKFNKGVISVLNSTFQCILMLLAGSFLGQPLFALLMIVVFWITFLISKYFYSKSNNTFWAPVRLSYLLPIYSSIAIIVLAIIYLF